MHIIMSIQTRWSSFFGTPCRLYIMCDNTLECRRTVAALQQKNQTTQRRKPYSKPRLYSAAAALERTHNTHNEQDTTWIRRGSTPTSPGFVDDELLPVGVVINVHRRARERVLSILSQHTITMKLTTVET